MITVKQLAKQLAFEQSTIFRMVKDGRLPKPVKLGSARNSPVRFDLDEVTAYLAAQKVAA
jgi:excisionase family DNA binding protein